MILRAYQDDLFKQVVNSSENLLAQLDTGAGKTPIIGKCAAYYEYAVVVCHRNILIKQASEKLAMCGVEHAIMASNATKKIVANNNIAETGRHFINPRNKVVLVSVDTFNSQLKLGKELLDNSKDWIILLDEAHHFAEDNKWQTMQKHLDCRVVGFTATPVRGDGQPMLKQFGGFFNRIVQAEGYENNSTERLIAEGWLSQYTAYYCEPSAEVEDSNGNIYLRKDDVDAKDLQSPRNLALGRDSLEIVITKCKNRKTLVVFPRIDIAESFIEQAKEVKHNAATIHSKLPQYEIQRILQAYKKGNIQTLVSVDMVNEGFDLPNIESLVICRDISSFGFYRQICGRGLRPEGKPLEIWDLAGSNILRHGLPSDPINWNESQAKQRRKDLRICPGCNAFVKRKHIMCPHCGKELERRSLASSEMTITQYISTVKQQHRQEIQAIERERLRNIEREQARIAHQTTYIDHSAYFSNTLVGKRCRYFFEALKKQLQYLDCQTYNDFFIENIDNFNNMQFYIGTFTAGFDKNQLAQCKKLYEKHK